MPDAPAESWYSVRCLFLHPPNTYEERITLWEASSFRKAIESAETEAQEYAEATGAQYCGLAQAYWVDGVSGSGSEVFSLMRDSTLEVNDYLDHFFTTGAERGHDINDH